ncbi:hypothetical protein Nepgr_017036 [Nepenthes gracilis]|uniref:Response regulatory domain-containing protein n=1 Tax=Nepenthes gracilis TaxID=150966 RepID=A0AAD3XT13_NEPGR|nr:hypothetical protein Nepgr_017036 [Nepenthes gracilis]
MAWDDDLYESAVPDRAKGMQILLIDPDTSSLLHTGSVLEEASYKVTTIEHQAVALTLLRERRDQFDVVIVDAEKQDMDCITFLRRIRIIKDKIPVILMSTMKDSKLAMRALDNGASFFLQKPLSAHDLKNLWQHVIRLKRVLALQATERAAIEEARTNHREKEAKTTNTDDPSRHLRVDPKGKNKQVVVVEISEEDQLREQQINGEEWMPVAKEKEKQAKRGRKGEDGDEGEGRSEKRGKKPIEVKEKNRKACTFEKKKRSLWNPELYKTFMEGIRRGGDKEGVSPKMVHEVMDEPNVTQRQVASNLQKFRMEMQQLSYATAGTSSQRVDIHGGRDSWLQKETSQDQSLRLSGLNKPSVKAFPSIAVTSSGLRLTPMAAANFETQRETGALANNSSAQIPQFPLTDHCHEVRIPSNGANARDMAAFAPCPTNVSPPLQVNGAGPPGLLARIKQARDAYRTNNNLSKSRLSNGEFSELHVENNGAGDGARSPGCVPSVIEHTLVPFVGRTADSNRESNQFFESTLSPNIDSWLVEGLNTPVTGLNWSGDDQMAQQNALDAGLMNSGWFVSSSNQLPIVDQTQAIPDMHAPGFTLMASVNDFPTGFPTELDPSFLSHPSNQGQATMDCAGLNDLGNQPANNSCQEKFDEFNFDALFPELQDGVTFADENFDFSSEDLLAILHDYR